MGNTVAQYSMIDPGTKYNLDVEKARMFITNAATWDADAREREIERNSMGWNILRAYGGMSVAVLEDLSGKERFELLTEIPPRLVFGTPRPDWAFTTEHHDLLNQPGSPDSMSCTHRRTLLDTQGAYVAIERFDSLDISGEVVTRGPSVVVNVDDDNMSPPALLKLSRATRAATEQLAWINRA